MPRRNSCPMDSAFDLTGRVAVVTGGNGGIGLGMAAGLARSGASVMIAARDTRKSEAALAVLRDTGAPHAALEVDVLSRASIERMFAQTVERFGRLDILITNAG